MFRKIMAPVDLEHADRISKAREVAADLGKHYGVPVVYFAATASTPGPMGHTPTEFGENLKALAKRDSQAFGYEVQSHVAICHDPAAEVEESILKGADELGADLIVMASHVPGIADHLHLLPSHGGEVAKEFKHSVMIVRLD